jgi:hypothetical protein
MIINSLIISKCFDYLVKIELNLKEMNFDKLKKAQIVVLVIQ